MATKIEELRFDSLKLRIPSFQVEDHASDVDLTGCEWDIPSLLANADPVDNKVTMQQDVVVTDRLGDLVRLNPCADYINTYDDIRQRHHSCADETPTFAIVDRPTCPTHLTLILEDMTTDGASIPIIKDYLTPYPSGTKSLSNSKMDIRRNSTGRPGSLQITYLGDKCLTVSKSMNTLLVSSDHDLLRHHHHHHHGGSSYASFPNSPSALTPVSDCVSTLPAYSKYSHQEYSNLSSPSKEDVNRHLSVGSEGCHTHNIVSSKHTISTTVSGMRKLVKSSEELSRGSGKRVSIDIDKVILVKSKSEAVVKAS